MEDGFEYGGWLHNLSNEEYACRRIDITVNVVFFIIFGSSCELRSCTGLPIYGLLWRPFCSPHLGLLFYLISFLHSCIRKSSRVHTGLLLFNYVVVVDIWGLYYMLYQSMITRKNPESGVLSPEFGMTKSYSTIISFSSRFLQHCLWDDLPFGSI